MLPTIQEYKDSFRNPSEYFKTLTLASLPSKFDENEPYFIAGGFACVFKLEDQQNEFWAFKCFLQDDAHRNQRLEILSDFLKHRTENYFLPTHYYTDELWVCSNLCEDGEYPTLAMKWVEGLTLGEYVHKAAKDKNTQKLTAIYEAFLRLAHFLLTNDFAHGDLKHDNILVDKDENLILIDYDGMYLPSLTAFPSPELGGHGYQHPKRTAQDWGRHIDDFSILVILLSLRAYILLPSLIDDHKNENLLLTSEDLQNPMQSKPLQTLWQQNDEPLKHLLGMLLNSLAQNNLRVLEIGVFVERNKKELDEIYTDFSYLVPNLIVRDFSYIQEESIFDVTWWNGLDEKWQWIFMENTMYDVGDVDFFDEVESLTFLSLNKQNVKEIPEWIGNLTQLKELHLFNNELNSLPKSIENLSNLKELGLGENQLTSLPESIENLINLTKLNLNVNQLTSLPESIENLSNLKELGLGRNQFTSLPKSLGNLANLTLLSLYQNQLTFLPDSIKNLASLEELVLSENQLTSLPNSIGNLTNLTLLSLYHNQLTSLPDSIGNLTNLTNLHLHQNQLTSLPDSIGNLTKLTMLSLYQNQLTSLPDSIGNLTNLTLLYLHYNQLIFLSEIIGNLTNLNELYLFKNQLTSLPDSIGNLTNLEKLDLRVNRLTKLPDSIRNLTNLKMLDLSYNPIGEEEQEKIKKLLPNCNISF